MKIITLVSLLICLTPIVEKPTNNDFDFYIGKWNVFNKRQIDDGKWITFDAKVEARKTLNGLGNIDFFEANIDGESFSGMTVRFYDHVKKEWHIKWYDSDNPMEEPTPSIGNFENGVGTFYKTITTESGHKVKVRFLWSNIKKDSFDWESGWSIDGISWNTTWAMNFTRIID